MKFVHLENTTGLCYLALDKVIELINAVIILHKKAVLTVTEGEVL